jgi:hypothetical protein
MKIKEPERLLLRLMFTAVGVRLPGVRPLTKIGVGARMGPGYFPLVLGVLLALIWGWR